MSSFKIGDRVHHRYGDGTVRIAPNTVDPLIGVEFDKPHKWMHEFQSTSDLNPPCRPNSGYWCEPQALVIISQTVPC